MRRGRADRTRTASRILAVAGIAAALGCGGASVSTPSGGGGSGGSGIPPSSGPQGTVVTQVSNEGWLHVFEGTAVTYQNNPPASGPHYPVWLRYEEFTTALSRGYWVHNLEHGAIVFLYRPDAPPAVVAALRDVYRALPPDATCGHRLAVMLPDPLMPRPVAAVAADWVLQADGVDAPTINAFVTARRGRGPERVCDPGARP